jgi:hypothetical protein
MSLSPFVSFQSRFVTYLLTFPRMCIYRVYVYVYMCVCVYNRDVVSDSCCKFLSISLSCTFDLQGVNGNANKGIISDLTY